MSTPERKQIIDPSVLEAVKRLQRRDAGNKLAEALRECADCLAEVQRYTRLYKRGLAFPLTEKKARAALAEWDAQS